MTYDAWKLRSDLDDADRRQGRPRLCEFCGAPLSDDAWAEWSADGEIVLFCDECASERDDEFTSERMGEPSPTANRETPK